jgi:hypothetical protein
MNGDANSEGTVEGLETVEVQRVEKRVSPRQAAFERQQANQRFRVQTAVAYALLLLTALLSVAAFALLWRAATSPQPDTQKLAYGVLGATLATLWSNVTKLIERITAS